MIQNPFLFTTPTFQPKLIFAFCSKSRDLYAIKCLTDLIGNFKVEGLADNQMDVLRTLRRRLDNLLEGKSALPDKQRERGK
jgi:hypothetical protein